MNNWNGEGMPSVGEMILTKGNRQYPALAVDEQGTICLSGPKNGLFIRGFGTYFAIPNKEKIEKKEAIDAIIKDLKAVHWLVSKDLAEILIDKGYHNGNKTKPLPRNWKFLPREADKSYSDWVIDYCGIEIEGSE